MTERFKTFRFRADTLDVIDQANDIIEEYTDQGYELTLRQLYYQFVARDLILNTQRSYKRLGGIVNDARLAGLIDWRTIKDRTREHKHITHWDNPEEIIESCARSFTIDLREDQPVYMEVWVEKEALAGIIERVCRKLDISWFACRGYVSQSAMYEASERIFTKSDGWNKEAIILHLGDHDPSGLDMTGDIERRMEMFDCTVEVRRLALNMDQVKQYSPPPNFAKITDSRYAPYREKYGKDSWELDALEPSVISNLVEDEVDGLTDPDLFEARLKLQKQGAKQLAGVNRNWPKVVKFLEGR